MARVDPFVIPLPTKLALDKELAPFFNYMIRFLHDMWKRTGAGEDLVGDAVTPAEMAAAITAHTNSANNATDAEVATAIAVHTASNDNITLTEQTAAILAHTVSTDNTTAAELTTAITTHEGASDPHPTYLKQAEADGLYDPLGTAAGLLPDIADDFADDAAAATGGVAVGRLYHTAGVVKVRRS